MEQGERVSIRPHERVIAELVQPSANRLPKFGTLNGLIPMPPEEVLEATRPMTAEEAELFLEGRY